MKITCLDTATLYSQSITVCQRTARYPFVHCSSAFFSPYFTIVTFFMLHFFQVVLFSCCTFSCCIVFALHFGRVALFPCWKFLILNSLMLQSCCTFFMLHFLSSFPLFSYWATFMLLFLAFHSFHVAFSSCCTLFM